MYAPINDAQMNDSPLIETGARSLWFRYFILVILAVIAIITPAAYILNLCLFAAPMIALYTLSIGVAWPVTSKQGRW